MIRVGIAARQLREGEELGSALAQDERIEIVNVSTSLRALSWSRPGTYDVVVAVSLEKPVEWEDGPPLVLLSDAATEELPGMEGPHAVLPRGAGADEVAAAVMAAAAGLFVLTDRQVLAILRSATVPATRAAAGEERLTARELDVLRMLADGLANKEIAQALGISDHTVKYHVAQIFAKLDVSSRAEAVTAGIRGGWLSI